MNLRLDTKIARTAATAAAALFLIAGAAFGADAIMNQSSPGDDATLVAPQGQDEPSGSPEAELEDETESESAEPSGSPETELEDENESESAEPSGSPEVEDEDETAEPSDDPDDSDEDEDEDEDETFEPSESPHD